MAHILYYDCFSGISGDMNLGAMIDLGVDRDRLLGEIGRLDIGPYEIKIQKDQRKGIEGTRVEVVVPADGRGDGRGTPCRHYPDIVGLIDESGLSERVKTLSLKIFRKIAEAEAKVHGHPLDEVHFHEVGAVDSIVDVVGAAVCLEALDVDRIIASAVQVGGGYVTCDHGTLPVPAPATAEILRGIPIRAGLVPFETTTPTGAAILAATVDEFTERPAFTILKTGYGIGQRNTDIPNVLRVFLGETEAARPDDDVTVRDAVLVECNIDDMNPEMYSAVMERLFAGGALDVFLTPIIMKKSRPAIKISILCEAADQKAIEEVLWIHTTTFGVRSHVVSKTELKREFTKVSMKYGDVSLKHAYLRGRKIKSKPEYEECRKLAREKGVSLKEIYDSLRDEEGSS